MNYLKNKEHYTTSTEQLCIYYDIASESVRLILYPLHVTLMYRSRYISLQLFVSTAVARH